MKWLATKIAETNADINKGKKIDSQISEEEFQYLEGRRDALIDVLNELLSRR